MSTETNWVYRVDEPRGSAGRHFYGDDPERWRGTITSAHLAEGAQHAAALVVTDLITEWDREGCKFGKHVHVLVWEGVEGSKEDVTLRGDPAGPPRRVPQARGSGRRSGDVVMPPLVLLRPPSEHVRATARTSYPGRVIAPKPAARGECPGEVLVQVRFPVSANSASASSARRSTMRPSPAL